MAEGIVSNLAAKALETLGGAALKEAASWWGARADLKKLENTIRMIQARVRDAERHQEENGSDVVKEWLRRLRMVLYQADDLFDLVLTIDRQKQQQVEVNKQVCVSFSRSGTLSFNWKISREIKSIRQQLYEIKSDVSGLNLPAYDRRDESQLLVTRFFRNRETGSFVKADDVIGRETEKNIIIGMLFDPSYDDGNKITVIPVVGFGGLGKTTLAQLVFNDENVQKHFDLAAWACVPEVGDQSIVMRRVYQSLTGDTDSYSPLVGQVKSGIQDSIKDKKYLLVLDDIWDDSRDSWLDLLSLLECGASGSRVIVTTRSANVAKVVGTTEAHNLGLLAEEESWNLFKKFAFRLGHEETNPVLTQLGKEIVESCGNVPLAIRVVGSLLYSENSERHWQRIINARLSKAKRNEDNNIMQVLKLSYDYLPPALKQCFAYCSLFEKDYTYKKNELVKLWMAQGYFDPSSTDTGEQYFLELLGRNLFQDPNEDNEGNVICCKMHDLVHDLAQDIAGEEMKLIEPLDQISATDGLMHVSFKIKEPEDDGWEAPVSLLAARKMRSLILSSSYPTCTIKTSSLKLVILKFQSLRVLDLTGMNFSVVPKFLGMLRHLRYLNLAENGGIKCLLDDITRLQNLQTLKLVGCYSLTELPRDFCKLDNLRHLAMAESDLSDLPLGFGKMTSLKELDLFVVGKSYGIDSLPPLNICELVIKFSKWRSDAVVEAQRANLKDNQLLTSLDFEFEAIEVTPNLSEMDKMLMFLQLPPNLKDIGVHDYKGVEIPRRWLDGLFKLVSVRIGGCSNCRVLPHLSRLPCLNELVLCSFDDLEYVEDEDDIWVSGGGKCGSVAQIDYFPSLTTLYIYSLRSLKGWTRPATNDDGEPRQLSFPRLRRMTLGECLKLTSMPLAPKLEFLEVKEINWKVLESNLMSMDDKKASSSSLSSSTLFTCLKHAEISAIEDGPTYLAISSKLSNLQFLTIRGCKELTSLTIESSNSIQHLKIRGCKSLESITMGNLSILEELELSNLEKLTQLSEEMGNLFLLRQLYISKCLELASLPQSLLGLTSLQNLYIWNCPHLKERYEKPNGQDWHLLQHIPKVNL